MKTWATAAGGDRQADPVDRDPAPEAIAAAAPASALRTFVLPSRPPVARGGRRVPGPADRRGPRRCRPPTAAGGQPASTGVVQLHLAGGTWAEGLLQDDHSADVHPEVWDLPRHVLAAAPVRGVLIERGGKLPEDFPAILEDVRRTRDVVAERGPAA
ncbi:hypothetical protein BJF78_04220 [Pseudonocardia sp. CNS-139]|nr:hypothetical protein BJF78_04220 [Pseudonocardia sp. CNS-139]